MFDQWYGYPISVRGYAVSSVAGEQAGERGVAFQQNRTSQILIQTKRNQIEQRANEARAIRRVRRELTPLYILLRAVESKDIDPWVLPETAGLSLAAPQPGR